MQGDIETAEVAANGASESELRDELHRVVMADLLGPCDGPEEEIIGTSVRDRYLVGKLAPKRVVADATAGDQSTPEGSASSEDGDPEEEQVPSTSLMPSSFGMTFCVDSDTTELEVEAAWGHYTRTQSEDEITESGAAKTVWKRQPAGGRIVLPLTAAKHGPLIPDAQRSDVSIQAIVRAPSAAGETIVTLFLVNDQEEPSKNKDVAWLFQPELAVRDRAGGAVFRRRPGTEGDLDEERAALAMIYRDRVEFAVGHGVAVHVEVSDDRDRATEIRTAVMPSYDVARTEIPTREDNPAFESLVLDMNELAALDRAELIQTLSILPTAYGKWIADQQSRIDAGDLAGFEVQAREAMARCARTQARLEEGIRTLERDDRAHDAFRFANRAMALQRVRTIYSQRVRRGGSADLSTIDVPSNRSWYPFQLAFFLLAIPSLADPQHAERTDMAHAIADLLWFPTGGGKTEAYLGIAAFTMATRRLQGELGGLDATRGVAVIMRYTLRLLTIQQFQRASALMCAMEVIRLEDEAHWGSTPFRIGLWVGQRATPNSTKDAIEAIRNAKGDSYSQTGSGSPQQLTSCPWCGAEIRLGWDMDGKPFPGDIGRTLTYCSDETGTCPFSRKQSAEGIPIVVVDEEIYRVLPAMIVGTVDKFAQMPWKGEVQTLFGRVAGECERHGFISPETDRSGKCRGNHSEKGHLPKCKRIDCTQLRPPDLIIQDEFHLISGPLGTLVGLYETAVDELCSWQLNDATVRPKIIASTATVRKAKEQAHGVFLRRVEIFPPHGLDVEDNFFSLQRPISEEKPGRRYLGICAPGMSRAAVLIRVYTSFLAAAQKLLDEYGPAADPWMTLLGYFNSLRELGGMRRLVEDDVRTRAFRVSLSDTQRPGLAQRDVRTVEELTSRASSTDIPRILDRLDVPFPRPEEGQWPIDVVLATNMISVGVDVSRLGLMVVNGQPKTTAEYIQATSRVGRRYPGLVCTVLNWSKPRDLSHYETFEHYHASFYQHVEAQSVTPFAMRALDRGLTGVLASMVRLAELEKNPNEGAELLDVSSDADAQKARGVLSSRAWSVTENPDVHSHVDDAAEYRIDLWVDKATSSGAELGYRGKKDGVTIPLLSPAGSGVSNEFTVPTSMREVEAGVGLIYDPGRKLYHKPPDWKPRAKPTEGEGHDQEA